MEEKTFHKKSVFTRAKMTQAELDKYYEEYRKYRYEKGLGVGGLFWRKVLHPVLLAGIKLERVIRANSVTVIQDKRRKNGKPKIYACTHIGGHDVETCFEAIKEHAFLFIGDPREAYRNFDGLLLFLNGMICLETRSVSDRKIAKENAIHHLHRGGNILIYPEGVWNITENLLVNPIFMGTASMALKTGADIIPMAVEQYGQRFLVNIGENIDITQWEIMEHNGVQQYQSITQELRDNWIDNIFARANYSYTVQDVYETQYKG